jgi:Rieske Fe-S protein
MSRKTDAMTQPNQPMDRTTPQPDQVDPSRRFILAAAAAVGTASLVAACGGAEEPAAKGSSAPAATTDSPATASSAPPSAGGESLTATADVPVGSGVILADEKVVVTQPTAGEFKAFSSTCTHMSCQLSGFADDRITCPCHGSSFSISDGTPAGGPATRPLNPIPVKVDGSNVVRS